MRGRKPAPPMDTSKPVIILPVREFRARMKDAVSHRKPVLLGDAYKIFAMVIPMNCSISYEGGADKSAVEKARAMFDAAIKHVQRGRI